VGIQIPTAIADNSYLGNIVLTRTADSKTDTYGGGNYRILPRIISLNPSSGAQNDALTVIGNHLCQAGSANCPNAFSYSTPIYNVLFDATNALNPTVWNWTNGDSSTNGVDVKVPAGSGIVAVKVTSYDYDSNTATFSYLSTVPKPPANLQQFKSDAVTEISVGGGTNGTTVILEADISATSSIQMFLEVEVKSINSVFDGTITASSTIFGPGTSYADVEATVSGLSNGSQYHWRARGKNSSTAEVSNWVAFGSNPSGDGSADGSPANIDFYVDTSGPAISGVCAVNPTASSCDSSQPTDIQAQIRWSTDESATRQIGYGSSCASGGDAATVFANMTSKQPSSPSGISSSPHSVILSGLQASQTYNYKIRSSDAIGNISYDPADTTCRSFGTSAPQTRVMKTLEFYIEQATAIGNSFSKNFDTFVSESKADRSNIYFKSVIIEIFGTSVGDGVGDITVSATLNGNLSTYILADPGNGKAISWNLSKATSSINFDCVYCTDNTTASSTLDVSVSGPTSNSLLGAKAIITYYYEPL
ncbi:MAG: hypothetical protein US36_C0010G0001, partial [Candidatus Wolfebacteria bacterium GW2011_GWC1_37_10]